MRQRRRSYRRAQLCFCLGQDLEEYQIHAKFVLLDTVTCCRSQEQEYSTCLRATGGIPHLDSSGDVNLALGVGQVAVVPPVIDS